MNSDRRTRQKDRRLLGVVLVGLLLLVPPTALRLACVGRTCDAAASAQATSLPFCSLPLRVRGLIEAGFREGRSPDVLAVSGGSDVVGGSAAWREATAILWPSTTSDTQVPIVFSGVGIRAAPPLPDDTGLVQVAPTIADAIGFRRPFPRVRSGQAVSGIMNGQSPRLVVEIAWKGVGARELESNPRDWPYLQRLLRVGAGTIHGTTGSLPLDPAATLTTIGTGGLPSEHGITGTLLRNTSGDLTRAWDPGAPVSIIATLPDDLDHLLHQQPKIGIVATAGSDRGIVGGSWYPGDRDTFVVASTPETAAREAAGLMTHGFGRDQVPDVLAVVMQGRVAQLDTALGRLMAAGRRASRGSVLFVVAGTGSAADAGAIAGSQIAASVDATAGQVVEAAVPGGLFLDQGALASAGITGQVARDALVDMKDAGGQPVMADAFQSYAVSFARYC